MEEGSKDRNLCSVNSFARCLCFSFLPSFCVLVSSEREELGALSRQILVYDRRINELTRAQLGIPPATTRAAVGAVSAR